MSNTANLLITHETTATVPCKWCRKPFLTDVIHFASGKTMQANVCDGCHTEREKMERPELNLERRKMAWDRLVGGYFSIFDPNRIPVPMQPHFEEVLKWRPYGPRGTGFAGKSRTGKSRVITELGRRLYVSGVDVFPTSGVEFQEKVVGQVNNREVFEEYLLRCKNCKVLLLDDGDKLKMTEAVEASYYSMLEHRRRFERPVLVTVNLSAAQMSTAASDNRGEPIVNRLRDLCEIIELK